MTTEKQKRHSSYKDGWRPITVPLPIALVERLDRLALADVTMTSEIVRRAIRQYLEQHPEKEGASGSSQAEAEREVPALREAVHD